MKNHFFLILGIWFLEYRKIRIFEIKRGSPIFQNEILLSKDFQRKEFLFRKISKLFFGNSETFQKPSEINFQNLLENAAFFSCYYLKIANAFYF